MALIAVLATLVLVICLTVRDHEYLGSSGILAATLMWLVAPVFALVRFRWMGWSSGKALWAIAAFFLWVVLCGLGKPGAIEQAL